MNEQFALFSSYDDLLANRSPWSFCNYANDDPGIAFPRDCGPSGPVYNQWNSLSTAGQNVDYFVLQPGAYPSGCAYAHLALFHDHLLLQLQQR